jgi:hypothetical protein
MNAGMTHEELDAAVNIIVAMDAGVLRSWKDSAKARSKS